jgi:hypothetical protein
MNLSISSMHGPIPPKRGGTGENLEEMVTSQLPVMINALDHVKERSISAKLKDHYAYESPVQLNIEKGDVVLVPRESMDPQTNECITDMSGFSVFNGSRQYTTHYDFHRVYSFAGLALEAFNFGALELAPKGVDVERTGINNFVNKCGRDLKAGEFLTWTPENLVEERLQAMPRKRQKAHTRATNVIKALIVPVDDYKPIKTNYTKPEVNHIIKTTDDAVTSARNADKVDSIIAAFYELFEETENMRLSSIIGYTPSAVINGGGR